MFTVDSNNSDINISSDSYNSSFIKNMIESSDWLCKRFTFNWLHDKKVKSFQIQQDSSDISATGTVNTK